MPLHYLIGIDALDKIDGTGGSDFLHNLIDVINKSNEKCLSGLKFFIMSRSDQGLITHVKSLERKQLYCLQDVKEEEAHAEFFTVPHVFLPESARIWSIPGIPQNWILAVLPAKIAISVPRNSSRFRNGHGITKTESTGTESPEFFLIVIQYTFL